MTVVPSMQPDDPAGLVRRSLAARCLVRRRDPRAVHHLDRRFRLVHERLGCAARPAYGGRVAESRVTSNATRAARSLCRDHHRPRQRCPAGRRARDLRHHGRPRARDDVPLALPARTARPPDVPDRRRGRPAWTVEQLVAHARRIDRRHRRTPGRGGVRQAGRPALVRERRPEGAGHLRADPDRDGWRRGPGVLPRDPARAVRHGRRRARGRRDDGQRPLSWRSRSATTWRRHACSPPISISTSTSRRSTGSTTTSARWASRRSCSCGSRTRCSSRCGTGTTSRACRSRWPRTSASRRAAASTTPSGRSAMSRSTT